MAVFTKHDFMTQRGETTTQQQMASLSRSSTIAFMMRRMVVSSSSTSSSSTRQSLSRRFHATTLQQLGAGGGGGHVSPPMPPFARIPPRSEPVRFFVKYRGLCCCATRMTSTAAALYTYVFLSFFAFLPNARLSNLNSFFAFLFFWTDGGFFIFS